MDDLISAHITACKAGARAKNTYAKREEILRRIDNDLPWGLVHATTEELADWLARDNWSAKTKCTYYEHIRSFFGWLGRGRYIDYDPSSALARPLVRKRAPKPAAEDELALILDRTEGFWRVAAELGAFEGLRACEVAIIRREEITKESVIVRGKGGVEIAIPTHERVWASVRDFPNGPLSKTMLGWQCSPNYISQTFPRKVKQATGLDGITFHRLRHRFGTILLMPKDLGGAGYDLRTVQELMRHASPNQTAQYTQITDRQRRLAIEALPVPTSTPC